MNDDGDFSNLRAQAQSDLEEGRNELFQELKRKSHQELYDIEPTLLARLTPKQREQLFRQEPARAPINRLKPGPGIKPNRRIRRSLARRAWIALPPLVRCHAMALVIAASTGAVALAALPHLNAIAEHILVTGGYHHGQ
tara:strand:+ start:5606 stop:6022 length:417 start_codon:yes stop_codon:yes gene_type:complete